MITPFTSDYCVFSFIQESIRLGIEVRWAHSDIAHQDATYHAKPGMPGQILLNAKTPRPTTKELCTLLAHEMVHVLQHWKGDLKALPPLGWPIDAAPPGRNLSIQEKEAYTAQANPKKVLKAIQKLKPLLNQVSP